MDYQLENLGPEKFQEICHALLAKAFPKTQCFPIGQRDGGRDAISYRVHSDEGEFVVYQVKFVRKPLAVDDAHKWVVKILEEEAPKLHKLVPDGAAEYILLTNVPGTAYPESGSIDTVQELLNKSLSVPSQCWWRDDLNRRLDDAIDIKWAYPEVLTGPDVIRLIVQNGLTEDSEKRTAAIKSFVKDQFDREQDVRFKQVELQNRLLDLFIDVPTVLRDDHTSRSKGFREHHLIQSLQEDTNHHDEFYRRRNSAIGAATLLLNGRAQEILDRVVVEGAPGQGKSTITQYICQIHRSRILQKLEDDPRIPDKHHQQPVRLPLKSDCRDFALWLDKRDPFSAEDDATVPDGWKGTLESFLAAQIAHFSGGTEFTVSDLHAVSKLSPLLLVFDGLDEVAEIVQRHKVVAEITKGVSRLEEVALSVQTIVTSRPAAFANSPGFTTKSFRYIELVSIGRKNIEEYVEKWLRAKRLDSRESADIRRILNDKLDQPHIRDLARNPMQLAILLSLVQTRGGSLPDKRTALYDAYVDLFFSRESEKSSTIRDHRDLLIEIHQHLAWMLHSEAQTKRKRGSISAERLNDVLESYLKSEGHETELIESLFTGMVERVVALVSRVEGTYEFEVQPLREYFAARYLYNTAPYSPAGAEQTGTLPDRFNALARDFFWLNVTRFFAGCYSRGQLSSLVECLQELGEDEEYQYTSHPSMLAAVLLSDWVFAQQPKSMRSVVQMVLEPPNLHHAFVRRSRHHEDDTLTLPKKSGNEELLDLCFKLLHEETPLDRRRMILNTVRANVTKTEAVSRWKQAVEGVDGRDLTQWLVNGIHLGVVAELSVPELEALLDDEDEKPERANLLCRGGQTSFIENNNELLGIVAHYRLDRGEVSSPHRGLVAELDRAISTFTHSIVFDNREPTSLRQLQLRFIPIPAPKSEKTNVQGEFAERIKEFVATSSELREQSVEMWATTLDPWNTLVEKGRSLFGDRWAFCVFGNTAAAIRSTTEKCDGAGDLHDAGVPLCQRIRHARLRANNANWWKTHLETASNDLELLSALMVLGTWAGRTVLEKNAALISERIDGLSNTDWQRLTAATRFGPSANLVSLSFGSKPSPKLIALVSRRIGDDLCATLYSEFLSPYEGDDPGVLTVCQRVAIYSANREPSSWDQWLPVIARAYAAGAIADRYYGHRFSRAIQDETVTVAAAKKIIDKSANLPSELVAIAETVCRNNLSSSIVPVGKVAQQQRWYES